MPKLNTHGLHHVTLICADMEETIRFYTELLGLRLVKRAVNFDDPSAKHFYFGDRVGSPGTLMTFFEYPDGSPGRMGVGVNHHTAFIVADETAQCHWVNWLEGHDVRVSGPYNRNYFRSIYFHDPDGIILEIATRGPGFLIDEDENHLGQALNPPPQMYQRPQLRGRDPEIEARLEAIGDVDEITAEMRLQGLHHVSLLGSDMDRTIRFYTEALGFRLVKQTQNFDDPDHRHLFFGDEIGRPGTLVTVFEYPDLRRGFPSVGLTHHIALVAEDEQEQLAWKDHLNRLDIATTEVIDRTYFKSIYFQDPDGVIVEIATRGPGFLIDEDGDHLGEQLKVPAWLAAEVRDEEE
ncbi:MAG: VOC family protein [Candidatus Bipolaricaulia bacterium]